MPKKTLWIVAGGLALVLYAAWRAGSYPARVALFNHSGRTVQDVTITTEGRRVIIGELRNGESRAVSVPSGGRIVITFRGLEERRWESPEPTRPAKAVILSIDGAENVSVMDKSAYR
jgi:hypothetical protein